MSKTQRIGLALLLLCSLVLVIGGVALQANKVSPKPDDQAIVDPQPAPQPGPNERVLDGLQLILVHTTAPDVSTDALRMDRRFHDLQKKHEWRYFEWLEGQREAAQYLAHIRRDGKKPNAILVVQPGNPNPLGVVQLPKPYEQVEKELLAIARIK